METFRYTLKKNQPKNYKSQRILFILLGILYSLLGFSNIFIRHKEAVTGFISSYVEFIFGISMIIGGIIVKHSVEKFFIQFDSTGVSASYKKLNVLWTNISKVHIAPMHIEIISLNEIKAKLPLDNLGYNDVQLVKSEFMKFANEKGIKIE